MHEQCVPGPLLSFIGPGNEANTLPNKFADSHLQYRSRQPLLQQYVWFIIGWRMGLIDLNPTLETAYNDLIWASILKMVNKGQHEQRTIPCPSRLLSMFALHRHPRSWNSSYPLVVDHQSRALNSDMIPSSIKRLLSNSQTTDTPPTDFFLIRAPLNSGVRHLETCIVLLW